MIESQFSEALNVFLARPTAASALGLINSCKTMIISLAMSWREKNLTLSERIREIMSEMLLILLEDFSAARIGHPHAVLAFLQMKIRRLTRPYRRRETLFGDSSDMSELGRHNFSAMRLQLADEIYQTVRRCLLGFADPKVGLLEFLFIHVYPELSWASRMLAQRDNIDLVTQSNADKKRHARFNMALRSELKKLQNGDLFEISSWSGGERSHLAWRIINIAPGEVAAAEYEALQSIENWRETIDRRQPQLPENLALAARVYNSMQQNSAGSRQLALAAEEAAPYGEESDVLLQLIGRRNDDCAAYEETEQWQSAEPVNDDGSNDELFFQVASQVSEWLDKLVSNQPVSYDCKKSKDQW